MVAFSTLIALDNGKLPFMLRLGSTVLCLGSFISSYFVISNDQTPIILVASSIIIFWNLIYVVVLSRGIRILLPITITCDLVAWMLAVGWGTLFAMSRVPELSGGDDCGSSPTEVWRHECEREVRGSKATVATCVLLWALTTVHLALFICAIINLRRRKRTVALTRISSADSEYKLRPVRTNETYQGE